MMENINVEDVQRSTEEPEKLEGHVRQIHETPERRGLFGVKRRRSEKTAAACGCPACMGLECLERPRYFPGQLLTEADLNSEQAYVLAKHRLHNRYLHGTGVVCGLQVVCHPECEGWVRVKSGYALDPCGNDIVVCQDHDFDVLEEIKTCRRKDRPPDDCDPLRRYHRETCKDVEEHWCLTIAYDEQETRPLAALHQTATCGSSGRAQVNACEPTRIQEGYRLGLFKAPPDHNCGTDWRQVMDDTLLGQIVECFEEVMAFLKKRVPSKSLRLGVGLLFSQMGAGQHKEKMEEEGRDGFQETITVVDANAGDLQALYGACCYLRQAVVELYRENPLGVRCSAAATIESIPCPVPPQEMTDEVNVIESSGAQASAVQYVRQVQLSIYRLYGYLLQYMIDCVCQTLLPPCPTDPGDDRLVLACMVVANGEIVRICNMCRPHAGAFPSLSHWLSIVPIVPLLQYLLQKACCSPNLGDTLFNLARKVDPTWGTRETVAARNFAIPRSYLRRLKYFRRKISLAGLRQMLDPASKKKKKKKEEDLLNMDDQVMDKSQPQAELILQQHQMKATWQEVDSVEQIPLNSMIFGSPLAERGEKLIVYTSGDKVVGYARHDPQVELREKSAELESLRQELSQLRGEVETLKRG